MRPLQASRERWGIWLLTILRSCGIATRTFADAWLGVSESNVRRLFTAEKALTVAHVECAPDDVAEAFVEEFVRRKFGEHRGMAMLARVMTKLQQEGRGR